MNAPAPPSAIALDPRPVLDRMSPSAMMGLCVVLVGGLAAIDRMAGPAVSIAVFYDIPLLLAAWYGRRRTAVLVAVICTMAGFWANHVDIGRVEVMSTVAWNTGSTLLAYLVLAALASTLRRRLDLQRHLSLIDPLTGVDNLRAFLAKVRRVLADAAESGESVATLYVDLDDFKLVNDRHGHAEGDEVLRQFARVLRDSVRATDTVARLGGDEFAVLLPDTEQGDAVELAERIRQHTLALVSERGWPVSLSIGLLVMPRVAAQASADEVLQEADRLMYRAKHAGKDRIELAELGAD